MSVENIEGPDEIVPSGRGFDSLPVVGGAAGRVRRFYDAVAPQETDPTRVRVAKEVFRYSSAVTGAAFVAMLVL